MADEKKLPADEPKVAPDERKSPTKGFKYHGPSDNLQLEEGGTVYHPGDVVPVSEELALHMARQSGLVFEGIDLPSTPGAGMSGALETLPASKPS